MMQRISNYKAVLPVAGLGTRLLPATKEQPKEMLPIFSKDGHGGICVKPMLQMIFESLYASGLRDFVFVVGRGKRAVEDHFTPDLGFITELQKRSRVREAMITSQFYEQLRECLLSWINQPEPLGFGHAVLITQHLIGSSPFLVHAGDTYVYSGGGNRHLLRMLEIFEERGAAAVLLLREVEDPRQYGVVEGEQEGEGVFRIKRIEEKPEKPRSRLAVLPLYFFKPVLFEALAITKPGKGGEIQLTDGIQRLIDWGLPVYGLRLVNGQVMDVGTPESYWDALNLSYRLGKGDLEDSA